MVPAGRRVSMVVTDLDGTLLNSAHGIGPADREALQALGRAGICRVAATGRNLYSLRRVLSAEDPFDYVVCSSGVGILDWRTQTLVRATCIPSALALCCTDVLISAGVSFMVHEPLPDNHRFAFHEASSEATDFRRRCELYAPYCREWDPGEAFAAGVSQFVVILPPDLARFQGLARGLTGVSVVRTTSPLDGVSLWMELFAAGTNKSGAAAWLAERLGVAAGDTYALGNDFNDLDLLEWAAHARVTANAPAELVARFQGVPSHDEAGFAHAVRGWRIPGLADLPSPVVG